MVSIAMFNNKGGVGKTTLTNNIASYIADYCHKRVLVVDCDPQCNTTQLVLGQEVAAEFYWGNGPDNNVTTISDILQPISDGDSTIIEKIVPIKSSDNRFNIDLIPGNPSFSTIEDKLGAAWHDLLGGNTGGIRITNWNHFFLEKMKDSYDFVFFDLGPSLGSINRSILIGCEYFLTPMGTDIFSSLGIKNISEWIRSWRTLYFKSIGIAEDRFTGRLAHFKVPTTLKIDNGYLGYTIQQYITKTIQGERRPTRAYDQIMNSVPDVIQDSLGDFAKVGLTKEELKLGDVPHLYSLIPLAQSNSVPILKLKGSDGLVGSQFKQQEEYEKILSTIVQHLFHNLEKANS